VDSRRGSGLATVRFSRRLKHFTQPPPRPQHVHLLPVPPSAPRRAHPARVERLRDPVVGGDPAGPDALDDREHLRCEAVGVRPDRLALEGGGFGRVHPVAEQGAGRLLAGKSVARPLRYQRALLLGEGGEQVQHERVGVGAELRDDEGHALRHEAEMNATSRDSRSSLATMTEALADTLVRVSHLTTHIEGHSAELDINPLMVLPSGQGVKAVDALVVLRGT
jgi:hypothetical protein